MSGFSTSPGYIEDDYYLGSSVSQSYPRNDSGTSAAAHQISQQFQSTVPNHSTVTGIARGSTQLPQYATSAYGSTGADVSGYTVQEYTPKQGSAGCQVLILLRLPLAADIDNSFSLTVEGQTVLCRKSQPASDRYYQYLNLQVPIPNLECSTQSKTAQLFLRIDLVDGTIVDNLHVGDFLYIHNTAEKQSSLFPDPARKRRLSAASYGNSLGPVKKTSTQQLQSLQRDRANGSTSSTSSNTVQARPQERGRKPRDAHIYGEAQEAKQQVGKSPIVLPRRQGSDLRPQSVPTAKFVHNEDSAQMTALPLPSEQGTSRRRLRQVKTLGRDEATVKGKSLPNPVLIRSSTLPATTQQEGDAADSSQSFNPYTIYADNKVFLELSGDLDRMAENWTDEELRKKRRLVEFDREQDGNQVTASFKPVTLQERIPNSICISCIWWEEKDETYVTSVDTIQLLESLVAVRFTTEEKNRVRRNLEGYKPLTVAKGKSDSEAFFKVIMDFPAPKPRNIEKDVKVFPWKILKHALQKIMGKYSASYASTASRIPQDSQAQARPADTSTEDSTPVRPHPLMTSHSAPTLAATNTSFSPAYSSAPPPYTGYSAAGMSTMTGFAEERPITGGLRSSVPLFTMPASASPQLSTRYQFNQPAYTPGTSYDWSRSSNAGILDPSEMLQPSPWQYGVQYAGATTSHQDAQPPFDDAYHDLPQQRGQQPYEPPQQYPYRDQ